MPFDAKVPTDLKKTQCWFGSIISRAIDENSQMAPISPTGRPMEDEACDYIRPSPALKPAQRIQIYNQQYWWRLLNALQEAFPILTRLFGFHDFNFLIAIPYLSKYPPQNWTLSTLGDRILQWIEEDYTANDKMLVLNAARVDFAFNHSFTAAQFNPLSAASEDLSMFLQPHIHLLQLPYDLLTFRVAFLKESPDYWIENDFPPLEKGKQFLMVLFRNSAHNISWSEISPAEFGLLQLFQKGSTINQACEWLESQEESLILEASQNLHRWFQEWVMRQWLY